MDPLAPAWHRVLPRTSPPPVEQQTHIRLSVHPSWALLSHTWLSLPKPRGVGSVLSSQGREAVRQGVPGLCPQHSPAPLPGGCAARAGFAAARRPCAPCWAPLGEPMDSQPVCSARRPNSSSSNHWIKSELRLGGPSTLQKVFGHKALLRLGSAV